MQSSNFYFRTEAGISVVQPLILHQTAPVLVAALRYRLR